MLSGLLVCIKAVPTSAPELPQSTIFEILFEFTIPLSAIQAMFRGKNSERLLKRAKSTSSDFKSLQLTPSIKEPSEP